MVTTYLEKVIGNNVVGKITDPLVAVEGMRKTARIFNQGSYLNERPHEANRTCICCTSLVLQRTPFVLSSSFLHEYF